MVLGTQIRKLGPRREIGAGLLFVGETMAIFEKWGWDGA